MKFGKTHQQKWKNYKVRVQRAENGVRTPVFTWLPLRLNTGAYAWLEWVNMYETADYGMGEYWFTKHYEEME